MKNKKTVGVIINQTNISLSFITLILILISFNYFLLFHSMVEIFSVIVSYLIFVITIYTYDKIENNFLIIIGIAYGFIGFFDLIHTLSYKGMNVFITTSANLPTQLWIIARYLESISILIALLFLGYIIKCNRKRILLILLFLSILLISFLYFDLFPIAFIENTGLTTFKIISEYIISSILILSLYLLYKRKIHFKRSIYKLIFVSILMTAISEISFTFYVDVYGLSNIIGHIFKLLSVILIFKAIIETGFKRPYTILYKELKEQKDQLFEEKQFINSIYNNIEQGICVHEMIYNKDNEPVDYQILDVNKAYEKILNIPVEKAIGSLGSNLYYSKKAPYLDIYADSVNNNITRKIEEYYEPMNQYFNITVTPLKEKQFITLFEDISELKEKEIELKNKYQEVQKLSMELEKLIYLTNRLSVTSKLETEEFLKDVLEIAMDLIESADYGSVSINSENKWYVLDSYNYQENLINELNKKRDLIYKNEENIFKIDLIKMNNRDIIKELDDVDYSVELKQYLKRISKKIKESIFFELEYNLNKKVRISLDIDSNSNKVFNENDEKILNALRNLIYVFLNINIESISTYKSVEDDIFDD